MRSLGMTPIRFFACAVHRPSLLHHRGCGSGVGISGWLEESVQGGRPCPPDLSRRAVVVVHDLVPRLKRGQGVDGCYEVVTGRGTQGLQFVGEALANLICLHCPDGMQLLVKIWKVRGSPPGLVAHRFGRFIQLRPAVHEHLRAMFESAFGDVRYLEEVVVALEVSAKRLLSEFSERFEIAKQGGDRDSCSLRYLFGCRVGIPFDQTVSHCVGHGKAAAFPPGPAAVDGLVSQSGLGRQRLRCHLRLVSSLQTASLALLSESDSYALIR